eukprot:gene40921-50022_t
MPPGARHYQVGGCPISLRDAQSIACAQLLAQPPEQASEHRFELVKRIEGLPGIHNVAGGFAEMAERRRVRKNHLWVALTEEAERMRMEHPPMMGHAGRREANAAQRAAGKGRGKGKGAAPQPQFRAPQPQFRYAQQQPPPFQQQWEPQPPMWDEADPQAEEAAAMFGPPMPDGGIIAPEWMVCEICPGAVCPRMNHITADVTLNAPLTEKPMDNTIDI